MSINLSNVNISLAEFQRLAKGDYNAGEVRLASENKLEKMNNHVHLKFLNNKTIDHAEVIAIKNAFVKALEDNGVLPERLKEIRQKLGLASSGGNWGDMSKLSMKPLTRQQIREIIDANAQSIKNADIQTSATIYKGGAMSSGNVAARDKVNTALAASTRSLDENVEISAFQIVATGQIGYVSGRAEHFLNATRKVLDALMEGCGGKPRADVQATATLKLESGLTLKIPTCFSELEFSRKLEDDIFRINDLARDGEINPTHDMDVADQYGKLDSQQARRKYFADLATDPAGGEKARMVAMKILNDAGIIDYDTLNLPNHMNDAQAIQFAKHLDSIRDLSRDAIRNDPTFKALTDSKVLSPRMVAEIKVPALSGHTFNSRIEDAFKNTPEDIPLPSFRNFPKEAFEIVKKRLGDTALPKNSLKPVTGKFLSDALRAWNNEPRVTAEEAHDAYIKAALKLGARRMIDKAIDKVVEEMDLKGQKLGNTRDAVLFGNPELLDSIANAENPEAAQEILAGAKDTIRDCILLSREVGNSRREVVDNAKSFLFRTLNITKESVEKSKINLNNLFEFENLKDAADKLEKSIFEGKSGLKTSEDIQKAFDKLANDFIQKRIDSFAKLDVLKDLNLPKQTMQLFKYTLLACRKGSKIDIPQLLNLARTADLSKAEAVLKNKNATNEEIYKVLHDVMQPILIKAQGGDDFEGVDGRHAPYVLFLGILANERKDFADMVVKFVSKPDVHKAVLAGAADKLLGTTYELMNLTLDPKINPYAAEEIPQANVFFPVEGAKANLYDALIYGNLNAERGPAIDRLVEKAKDDPDMLAVLQHGNCQAAKRIIIAGNGTLRTEEEQTKRFDAIKGNLDELRKATAGDKQAYDAAFKQFLTLDGNAFPPGTITKLFEAAGKADISAIKLPPDASPKQLAEFFCNVEKTVASVVAETGVMKNLDKSSGAADIDPINSLVMAKIFSRCDKATLQAIKTGIFSTNGQKLAAACDDIQEGDFPREMRGEMRQKPQRNIIATGLLASGMSSLGIFRMAVLNNVLDTLGETGQTLPPPAKPSLEEFKEIYNTLEQHTLANHPELFTLADKTIAQG